MTELAVGVATSLLMWWVSRRENIKDGRPINHGWYVWPVVGLLEFLLLITDGWASLLGWGFFGLLLVGAYGMKKGDRPTPAKALPTLDDPLDVLRFDYKGREDYAPRERIVEATGVDEVYVEGWCRKARGTRTFRLNRVTGEVVSLETGEIFPSAEAWRDKYIDAPRNRGVSPVPKDTWKSDR